jgi:hypothetical protein
MIILPPFTMYDLYSDETNVILRPIPKKPSWRLLLLAIVISERILDRREVLLSAARCGKIVPAFMTKPWYEPDGREPYEIYEEDYLDAHDRWLELWKIAKRRWWYWPLRCFIENWMLQLVPHI